MATQIDLEYHGNLRCVARRPAKDQSLVVDVPVSSGGLDETMSPTDLVAAALGACILSIVGAVGQRRGLDLTGMSARVTKEMAAAPLRRIGRMTVAVMIPQGAAVSAEDRQRLATAVQRCPVKHSLHPEIEVGVELVYSE